MMNNPPLDSFEMPDPYEHLTSAESDVVAKFYSSMEANIAAARLRSEGIPCFLSNQGSEFVQTQTMNVIRLHVHPDNREAALELLAETTPENESKGGSITTGLLIILAIFGGIYAAIYLLANWLL